MDVDVKKRGNKTAAPKRITTSKMRSLLAVREEVGAPSIGLQRETRANTSRLSAVIRVIVTLTPDTKKTTFLF